MSKGVKSAVRDSNFELLRILSMFMIVLLHIGTHGIQNYIDVTVAFSNYNEFFYLLLRALSIVAVTLYVMMSGFFLTRSNFKLCKLINLFFEVSFFSTSIYLVNVFAGSIDFSLLTFYKHLFAVLTGRYWFVTIYFALYALSPYLNILIEHMAKEQHLKLIVVSSLMFSLWQVFYPIDYIGVSRGFGLVYFMFLYILAAYIQKYDFIIKDFNKQGYLLFYLFGALALSFIVYRYNGTSNDMFAYNSPLVLAMSYSLFMYFKKLKIVAPKINIASRHVFGIYLIHEQNSFRQVLWGSFGVVEDILASEAHLILVKMLGYSILVFFICWIMSYVIKNLYNFTVKYSNKFLLYLLRSVPLRKRGQRDSLKKILINLNRL